MCAYVDHSLATAFAGGVRGLKQGASAAAAAASAARRVRRCRPSDEELKLKAVEFFAVTSPTPAGAIGSEAEIKAP